MTENFSKLNLCNEISEDLSAFIDGELAKEHLAKIYEHLIECESCRRSYEDLKITQKTLKNYFQRSTEEFKIPEKPSSDNIISKIKFAQNQKILIYSTAALCFLALISYFSISMIKSNSPEKEVLHKVKFTKETPVLSPLPSASKDFTKELKDKVLKKKPSPNDGFVKK